MTTTNQTAEEQLNVLWNQGFDEGGLFNENNPDVASAMNWLIQNHKKGQEFADQIKKCIAEINEAQMILAEIDNELLES